jgi:hypothetical protein
MTLTVMGILYPLKPKRLTLTKKMIKIYKNILQLQINTILLHPQIKN